MSASLHQLFWRSHWRPCLRSRCCSDPTLSGGRSSSAKLRPDNGSPCAQCCTVIVYDEKNDMTTTQKCYTCTLCFLKAACKSVCCLIVWFLCSILDIKRQIRFCPNTNPYFSVSKWHSGALRPFERCFSPSSPISFPLRSSSRSFSACLRAGARYSQACEDTPQPCNLSIFSRQLRSVIPSTSFLTPLLLMLLYPRSSSLR